MVYNVFHKVSESWECGVRIIAKSVLDHAWIQYGSAALVLYTRKKGLQSNGLP